MKLSFGPVRTGNTEIYVVILAWEKGPNHFFLFDYELMNFGGNNIGK